MGSRALSLSVSRDSKRCCNCGCSCSLFSTTASAFSWNRSLKRKFELVEDVAPVVQHVPADFGSIAYVEIENECVALRETLSSQQQTIQELYTELEEERNASASAANEAMGMILRLQREKAEIQMEARQFKRFAEEKMAHDQQEIIALEDMLYKKDQAIQALNYETQAYKHRMLSFGLTDAEVEGEKEIYSRSVSLNENSDNQYEIPSYDYPPLRCNVYEAQNSFEVEEDVDVEKYAFGETPRAAYGETPRAPFSETPCAPFSETPRAVLVETPRSARDHLQNLEYRIYQLEKTPKSSQVDGDLFGTKNILEKSVVGQHPRGRPRHVRRSSNDSSSSYFGMGIDSDREYPKPVTSFKKTECFTLPEDYPNSRKEENTSEIGDDMSDRVYTIDSIHNGTSTNNYAVPKASIGAYDDYVSTPRDSLHPVEMADPDIAKLYMRLQALEADRESMKQAIISMRTDKAQLILLREIAQHLYKDMSPERRMPVKKPSLIGSFSLMSVVKWIASFVLWRKKARRSKYMFGLSANNVGLLLLLDKTQNMKQWGRLSSTQMRTMQNL